MRRKLWAILLCSLGGAAVLWGFRQDLAVRLAPQVILYRAASACLEALEERYMESPAASLLEYLDSDGNQRIKMTLREDSSMGDRSIYDMELCLQSKPRRISAKGTCTTGEKNWDLSVYLDNQFAALSIPLFNEQYYGITYQTFSQDLREKAFLTALLGESVLQELESAVEKLQISMETEPVTVPRIPFQELRTGLMGLLSVKPTVKSDRMVLEGREARIWRMELSLSGETLAQVVELGMDQLPEEMVYLLRNNPQAIVKASFDIWDDKLLTMTLDVNLEKEHYLFSLGTGPEPEEDDVEILWRHYRETEISGWDIRCRQEGDRAFLLAAPVADGTDQKLWNVSWMQEGQGLTVSCTEGEQTTAFSANIRQLPEGMLVAVDRSGALLKLLGLLSESESDQYGHGRFLICPGTEITPPSYRDFSQWSMEDIFMLLENLGDLAGLHLG